MLRRTMIVFLASLALAACTMNDVGQTLYNTGKKACEQGRDHCGPAQD